MTPTSPHEQAWELLPAFVDDELVGEQQAAVTAHIERCETCRREVAALRDLIENAQGLPATISPQRDLWPDICARLSSAVQLTQTGIDCALHKTEAEGRGTLGRLLSSLSRPRVVWPTCATTVAVIALILWFPHEGREEQSLADEIDPTTQIMIAALETECDQGESQVLAAAQEASDEALGDTWHLMVANLQAIDLAIQEAREAWRSNPRSPHLARMMIAAYRAKSSLLGEAKRLVKPT